MRRTPGGGRRPLNLESQDCHFGVWLWVLAWYRKPWEGNKGTVTRQVEACSRISTFTNGVVRAMQ